MILGDILIDVDGVMYKMVGFLVFEISFVKCKLYFGY